MSLLNLLRDDQAEIIAHPAKTKILSCGRRWGKTYMAGVYALTAADHGAQVAWIAPTYKNSRPLWRFCEQMTSPVAHQVNVNKSEREITFPSGGRIGIYSADNPDSIRGEAFHVAIIDEAARVTEETWLDAIQPTLADYAGRAILISTPKGKNWFYLEYQRAIGDGKESAAWHSPSSANPNPNIKRAAELARERVPERTYRQEWLAEFVEGGVLFRNVRELATLAPQVPEEGHDYVIGVDWARTNDYTVFSVMDSKKKTVVCLDRFTDVTYPRQMERLTALHQRYNNARILAEYNAMGGPMVEFAQQSDLPVQQFDTTIDTKIELIDKLVRAFEFRELHILNDPILISELETYEELRRTVQGKPVYGAPEGLRDDCVMSLALAWHMISLGDISGALIQNYEYSIADG